MKLFSTQRSGAVAAGFFLVVAGCVVVEMISLRSRPVKTFTTTPTQIEVDRRIRNTPPTKTDGSTH